MHSPHGGLQPARTPPARRAGTVRTHPVRDAGGQHQTAAFARTSTTRRRSAASGPDGVNIANELIDVFGDLDLTCSDVLVNATFAALPLSGPEPCLIRRDRHLRVQLDDPILPLNYLDLRSGLVQPVATSQVGWQDDFAPSSDSNERSVPHNYRIAEIRYYGQPPCLASS